MSIYSAKTSYYLITFSKAARDATVAIAAEKAAMIAERNNMSFSFNSKARDAVVSVYGHSKGSSSDFASIEGVLSVNRYKPTY